MLELHVADQKRQRDDFVHVLLRFRGQTQDEIEFEVRDAAAEDHISRTQDIVLRHALVDHLPEPLRSRFWSDGNGLVPARCQPVEQRLAHRVRTERRDRQASLDGGAELADVGIVRQRGPDEPDLSALLVCLYCLLLRCIDTKIARRQIDIPGHAEPAVPAAAAGDLREIHIAELGIGRQNGRRSRQPVKILCNAFYDLSWRGRLKQYPLLNGVVFVIDHVVELRDIDAGDPA